MARAMIEMLVLSSVYSVRLFSEEMALYFSLLERFIYQHPSTIQVIQVAYPNSSNC
jgi:hypothetical protein